VIAKRLQRMHPREFDVLCRRSCWQCSQRSHRTSKMKPVPLMMASLPMLWGPSPVTPSAVRGQSPLMMVQPPLHNDMNAVMWPALYDWKCMITHPVAHNAKFCVLVGPPLVQQSCEGLSVCCAVLCCAVLCCAVLCCAVLCCAVPEPFGKRYNHV